MLTNINLFGYIYRNPGTFAVRGAPIFGLPIPKIGTRGFSDMPISNMKSVFRFESCVKHFYQDVGNLYQDYKISRKK